MLFLVGYDEMPSVRAVTGGHALLCPQVLIDLANLDLTKGVTDW